MLTALNVVAIDAHDHLPHAVGLDVLAPEGELPVAGRFTGGEGEVVSAREGEGPPVGVADQRFAEGIVKVNRVVEFGDGQVAGVVNDDLRRVVFRPQICDAQRILSAANVDGIGDDITAVIRRTDDGRRAPCTARHLRIQPVARYRRNALILACPLHLLVVGVRGFQNSGVRGVLVQPHVLRGVLHRHARDRLRHRHADGRLFAAAVVRGRVDVAFTALETGHDAVIRHRHNIRLVRREADGRIRRVLRLHRPAEGNAAPHRHGRFLLVEGDGRNRRIHRHVDLRIDLRERLALAGDGAAARAHALDVAVRAHRRDARVRRRPHNRLVTCRVRQHGRLQRHAAAHADIAA